MTRQDPPLLPYQLDDRYTKTRGRVFLTGTQALVRIMLDQARRDQNAGLNTKGFVSGYRGSPLGALDLELWRARDLTDAHRISFMPAVNEDLGATAVLGAQQAVLDPDCEVDGVFSMWYGKGPGVDRSGDALKHGNAYGSAPKGGVLVVAGDDHGCVSSSMPHQSDVAFMSWFMPTLNPSSIAEYLEFGAYGLALSRFSGTWVGFKAISETVEAAQSVELRKDRVFYKPDIDTPSRGLHIRPSDLPSPEIETRIAYKLAAVEAFAESNPIDRRIYDIKDASFGFVTTGKGHLDLMEALRLLDLDENTCRRLGIDIYKVGMVWPLARRDALAFVRGKREVMVIEEKRGIIESQFKEYFYDWPGDKPDKMVGKHRAAGDPLLPWVGELSPLQLVPYVAERLAAFFPEEGLIEKANALTARPVPKLNVAGATRTPYFCSGCPHNTSTRVPDGSRAASGIGCHVMASWMGRNTGGYAQMGGEGVPHLVASQFSGNKHIFQNLGEGTWYHSGSLAIRQAMASNANITYKILYNDAVAMTGGQPVDGPVSVQGIAQTCRAEGVRRIALVSDDIGKFTPGDFPHGVSFHDRSEMDEVQRELRVCPGVSVLIYEQACATEKRRRRKRGSMEDPKRFAVINPDVCEGCGDCSVASNCLSIEPIETPLGRKRKVNLSTCNKDFSCLDGFCPSFVTIEGAERKTRTGTELNLPPLIEALPTPTLPTLATPFDLLVTGVGGTGVVTVGALITMAAHLEGKGSSVLDFTGFAQKFGTVLSYIRIGRYPEDINQVRIDQGAADAVIGCDIVVSSAPKASAHYRNGTKMALNLAQMPTGDVVLNRDADLKTNERQQVIARTIGADNLTSFDANEAAERLLGDAVFANVMMLGFAWQKGLVPVSKAALIQAIKLNGVAIARNLRAFDLGRVMAHSPDALRASAPSPAPRTAADIINHRAALLTAYQDTEYALGYRDTLARFHDRVGARYREELLQLAARSLYKLMAYKDEYEVARLHTQSGFLAELETDFQPGFTVNYHLSPPGFPGKRNSRGHPKKRQFGPFMGKVMAGLARYRFLRGRWYDPFGHTAERRMERRLIIWFQDVLKAFPEITTEDQLAAAQTALSAPMDMRGFGPVKQQAVETYKPAADRALQSLGVRSSDVMGSG